MLACVGFAIDYTRSINARTALQQAVDAAVLAAANDPSLCDSFKSNGFTLAVIDVKYLDATGEFNFDAYVSGYYNDISPSLQACASPGLYFQATDSNVTALSNAFNDVAKALKKNLVMN